MGNLESARVIPQKQVGQREVKITADDVARAVIVYDRCAYSTEQLRRVLEDYAANHPTTVKIASLEAQVEALSAPVSDKEWMRLHEPFMCTCDDTECSCKGLLTLSRETLTEWLAARLAATKKAGSDAKNLEIHKATLSFAILAEVD